LIASRDRPFFGILGFYYRGTTVMNSFWRFLRDKRNQQVLGWLGGGLVAALTGLWAAFVYFFPPPVKSSVTTSSEPTAPSVQANCGGIAIGRDVTGSTITAGSATNSDCAPKPK
jgi:hypothetical protein